MAQGDADRVAMMAEQVALYLGGDEISRNTLLSLFSAHASPNEFRLFELAAGKDLGGCARLLDELFEEGKNPYALAGLLQRSVLELAEAQIYSSTALGNEIGLPGWRASKVSAAAKRFNKRDLWKILIALLRGDERLKGKSIGTQFEIQRLVEAIAVR